MIISCKILWGQRIQQWTCKFCGRQPLKKLLSPLLSTLSHIQINKFAYFP